MDEDKEKSLVEKVVDKINDTVESIATAASDALHHAMDPEPVPTKSGETVVLMPMAGPAIADPLMPPTPMVPVVISRKRRPSKNRPPAKGSPKKAAAKTASKRSSKKGAKKAAKKIARKSGKARLAVGRKAVRTKKAAKKAAKKRKSKR